MSQKIVLIAHDNLKPELIDWARVHLKKLAASELYATGTTGTRLEQELGLSVHKHKSGPLGGDLQIGAQIVEGSRSDRLFLGSALAAPA